MRMSVSSLTSFFYSGALTLVYFARVAINDYNQSTTPLGYANTSKKCEKMGDICSCKQIMRMVIIHSGTSFRKLG
jgi:hypothetical protein